MEVAIRNQALKYAAIGGIATGVQYGLFAMFVAVFKIHPVAASALAFSLSALLNYQLNHGITFHGLAQHATALPRFFMIALVGLVLNTAFMALCYSVIGLHYIASQVAASVIVFFWSFMENRLWSFR